MIMGFVDYLDVQAIKGWAIDEASSNEVVRVSIFLRNRLLATLPCDLERTDLAGRGLKHCAFAFKFSSELDFSELQSVRVEVVGNKFPLPISFEHFRQFCAKKYFPYYGRFEYVWWQASCFEAQSGSVDLTGDLILPPGSAAPTIINGAECFVPETGLPTFGRAKSFWYADEYQSCGFRVPLCLDPKVRWNDVFLRFLDNNGVERVRPVARVPMEGGLGQKIPPAQMLARVIGSSPHPYGSFVIGGATNVFQAEFLLEKYLGRSHKSLRRILDWGCGNGRSTWAFADMWPAEQVIGVDIDSGNLEWAQKIAPRAKFIHSSLYPRLPIEDASVDFIYSQSVFTHLSETAQDLWLDELWRILAPNGAAIISLQLEVTSLARAFNIEAIEAYRYRGIEDYTRDAALRGYISDRNYYRSTFHTREYITDRWGAIFDVEAIDPGFIGGHQDAVILTKKRGHPSQNYGLWHEFVAGTASSP